MRRRLILFFWIAGILFPLAWLGQFSPGFRQAFDAIFRPLWMHILMHAGLFAVLALLLTLQLARSLDSDQGKRLLIVLGIVLGVGLLQEGFQSLSQGAFSPGGAVFDLGVDLAGGLLGWGTVLGMTIQRRKTAKQG